MHEKINGLSFLWGVMPTRCSKNTHNQSFIPHTTMDGQARQGWAGGTLRQPVANARERAGAAAAGGFARRASIWGLGSWRVPFVTGLEQGGPELAADAQPSTLARCRGRRRGCCSRRRPAPRTCRRAPAPGGAVWHRQDDLHPRRRGEGAEGRGVVAHAAQSPSGISSPSALCLHVTLQFVR